MVYVRTTSRPHTVTGLWLTYNLQSYDRLPPLRRIVRRGLPFPRRGDVRYLR
jgi:hypothetical protein